MDGNWYICWNGYGESENSISLLKYIEENSEEIKNLYLNWIRDIAHHQVGNKSIVEQYQLVPGFSLWWMSLLVEKSIYKSPHIFDALRLLALEKVFSEKGVKYIESRLSNPKVSQIIKDLCARNSIESNLKGRVSLNSNQNLIKNVRYILSLFKYKIKFFTSKKRNHYKEDGIFICSFFFHLNKEALQKGEFSSNYWPSLSSLIKERGDVENWLQIFYAHSLVSTPKVALSLLEKINSAKSNPSCHEFLDNFLSFTLIFKVLVTFFKLPRLRKEDVLPAFKPKSSELNFWPLFEEDWKSSFDGPVALENLLWFYLFEQVISSLPEQKLGLFLCENQAWERAFAFFWKDKQSAPLIGVPHSTIRYWDLRYFNAPQGSADQQGYVLPEAGYYALNGPTAMKYFLDQSYNKTRLLECEALRFGHLLTPEKSSDKRGTQIRVLLLGDYDEHTTLAMLNTVCLANKNLGERYIFSFKPHPNMVIDLNQFDGLNMKPIDGELSHALQTHDIIVSSNATSAAVEGLLYGLSVVVFLDENNLNFSPLRGVKGAKFISSPGQLSDILVSFTQKEDIKKDQDMFYLDDKFKRWQSILAKKFQ